MKIGDYVRTINGKIWIIKSQQAISGHKKDIIKSSSNIIDLIEVGDYVNGFKVLEILSHSPQLIFATYRYYGHYYTKILNNEDIKSIVTKEQFKSMEYRIGE